MTSLKNHKKILVIGSGGREHAICKAFKQSKYSTQIFALNGNAGIKEDAEIINNIKPNQHLEIANFCKNQGIDMVFIGPEQPLVDGLSDYLRSQNIRCFGPSKNASQLEASKIFMKEIATKNNVPTAQYQTFYELNPAVDFIKKIGFPCVIKADGLASGKGVIIVDNFFDAHKNISEIFAGKFGEAGNKIIIEEFLQGFEASYFVICDGKNYLPLGFAHDHKKVGEGETGLNTGGMGTYSPSTLIDKDLEKQIIEKIIEPTLQGMNANQTPFAGILFAGLMIHQNQPKLLEFNVRFGDPETQVILPRITSDFYDLIDCAIDGKLNEYQLSFDEENKFVCVVMCAKGYPENYQKNTEIKNLLNLQNALKNQEPIGGKIFNNVSVLHAGTIESEDKKILANGGRVLNIVSKAKTIEEARKNAYDFLENIEWNEGFYRKDIALKKS
ncbi:MAG: phosphoribosylamine--glycine ligase [Alphaproteobacteria bacterium]